MLEDLKRIVAELPAGEAKDSIRRHIAGIKPPAASMHKFLHRRATVDDLSIEVLCLIWFLDGQIPFDQFDNEYFRALMLKLKVDVASSVTIVQSLLPALYRYAIEESRAFSHQCSSFSISFDAWSRFGLKFVSQHYHCICPLDFLYRVILLDFIPYEGPQFAESLAGALKERQEHWTSGTKLISATGMADFDAKGQAAGKLIFGSDDMLGCQNHRLKKAYEVGEAGSGQYLKDFNALVALSSAAATYGNVDSVLSRYQRLNDLVELKMLLYNDTRWEGREQVVSRGCALEASLVSNTELKSLAVVQEQLEKVSDFLSKDYFVRLKSYAIVLKDLNCVSKFYQTQRFPTGCFVPLLNKWMEMRTRPNSNMEPVYLSDMKASFNNSIRAYLVNPVVEKANNFLKAGLLHPGVARHLLAFVDSAVLESCFASLRDDSISLNEHSGPFFDAASNFYREHVIGAKIPLPDDIQWKDLECDGSLNGFSHMSFWRNVVTVPTGDHVWLNSLAPLAAMLLAVPAGESVDEFSFSSSQRTLSKERNSLLPTNLEQITVIRMFIRSFGLTPKLVDEWMAKQLAAKNNGQANK